MESLIRGYKTELDPNNKQRTLLLKNAGCARFAYNWALNIKQEAMESKEKIPSAMDLSKQLNQLKKTEFAWMYEVSKCSPQLALQNCDRAFDNFFRRCKQKVKKKGFPKFKSKRDNGSFKLTGSIKVFGNCIQLPRLGKINLKEKGYLPQDKKILSATVSERAGRWFVSIQVEEEFPKTVVNKSQASVGVDLGIKTLATLSDGTTFENPKALARYLERLKRLCRKFSKKQKGSNNKKKFQRKLAKLHYKIACIRNDAIHKLTSFLTKTKSRIVIEDLNVSGMIKNHKLAKAIADVVFGEIRRQLTYKSQWYGCELVIVDRFYPSSKKCSCCGHVKEKLSLNERTYECDICNLKIDRDLNAAINLLQYNTVSSTGINAFGDGSADLSYRQVKLPSMN